MPDSQKDEATALVHWTYSSDEWKNFMRWKKRKRGLIHFLLHLLGSGPQIPVTTISTNNVSIGNVQEFFYGNNLQLLRVIIRDAGDMNIMEIAYRRMDHESSGRNEIHVLVPRGRLKEAIGVEEQLNKLRTTNR
jgi:hypothetical protein